jgi:hypothetical protein
VQIMKGPPLFKSTAHQRFSPFRVGLELVKTRRRFGRRRGRRGGSRNYDPVSAGGHYVGHRSTPNFCAAALCNRRTAGLPW